MILSILLISIPGGLFLNIYAKKGIVDKEVRFMVTESDSILRAYMSRFTLSEQKLVNFREILLQELEKPVRQEEVAEFMDQFTLGTDGIWRNDRTVFNGNKESGFYLPNDRYLTEVEKVKYLRIKKIMDTYGSASTRNYENIWMLTQSRGEIIFDKTYPTYVFLMDSKTNFTQTPWLTLGNEIKNPYREHQFTPPLYDPTSKAWMVSSIMPMDFKGEWLGNIGEDMQLNEVISSIFKVGQRYPHEEQFLIDKNGNFILAGRWQKELERFKDQPPSFMKQEAGLSELLSKTSMESTVTLVSDNVLISGKKFIALGVKLNPTGWRYFRLVPEEDILASSSSMITGSLILIAMFGIMIGALIKLGIDTTIVNRINKLVKAMSEFDINGVNKSIVNVSGTDEIAKAARTFESVADEVTGAHNLLLDSEKNAKTMINVYNNTHDSIIVTDRSGAILDVNPAFSSMSGYSCEDVIGHHVGMLRSGRHDSTFYADLWEAVGNEGHWSGEVWNKRKNGSEYAQWVTISPVMGANGDVINYVGVSSDITVLKVHESQLEHIAFHDVLTGLPNRALLLDRVNQAMARALRENKLIAFCYLDIDGFKPINDSLGHAAGDRLLIELSKRMLTSVRSSDTVARLGGDEFVIILSDLDNVNEAESMITRVLEAISMPVRVDRESLTVSASAGVSVYPLDDYDADTLMRHADQAMYIAKQQGKNRYHLYDHDSNKIERQTRDKLDRITLALENDEFELFYQPKIDLKTNDVVGAEALIRWRDPERGIIPPMEFLPLIESSDLEVKIGNWVVLEAICQLNEWAKAGLTIEISINVSGYHLLQAGFVSHLKRALISFPLVESEHLQIEILETVALDDITTVNKVIRECCDLGVSFALDDFGTGYSSLSYLKSLPFHSLKIDQSFIRDMLDDPNDLAIVRGILSLADTFNRQSVAEGVETTDHLNKLRELGCDLGQGYGIARPMPAKDILGWVTSYREDLIKSS